MKTLYSEGCPVVNVSKSPLSESGSEQSRQENSYSRLFHISFLWTLLLFPGSFALGSLLFQVPPATRDALVMTVHAVNALSCLGKHQLIDTARALFTAEASGVVGIFTYRVNSQYFSTGNKCDLIRFCLTSHDNFVHDGFLANAARVGAFFTNGSSIDE
jgi:hypothetical protein